jgi:hypothetical protein
MFCIAQSTAVVPKKALFSPTAVRRIVFEFALIGHKGVIEYVGRLIDVDSTGRLNKILRHASKHVDDIALIDAVVTRGIIVAVTAVVPQLLVGRGRRHDKSLSQHHCRLLFVV